MVWFKAQVCKGSSHFSKGGPFDQEGQMGPLLKWESQPLQCHQALKEGWGYKGMSNSLVTRLTLNGIKGSKKDSRSVKGELSILERGRKKGEDVDESCYRVCCY